MGFNSGFKGLILAVIFRVVSKSRR